MTCKKECSATFLSNQWSKNAAQHFSAVIIKLAAIPERPFDMAIDHESYSRAIILPSLESRTDCAKHIYHGPPCKSAPRLGSSARETVVLRSAIRSMISSNPVSGP